MGRKRLRSWQGGLAEGLKQLGELPHDDFLGQIGREDEVRLLQEGGVQFILVATDDLHDGFDREFSLAEAAEERHDLPYLASSDWTEMVP